MQYTITMHPKWKPKHNQRCRQTFFLTGPSETKQENFTSTFRKDNVQNNKRKMLGSFALWFSEGDGDGDEYLSQSLWEPLPKKPCRSGTIRCRWRIPSSQWAGRWFSSNVGKWVFEARILSWRLFWLFFAGDRSLGFVWGLAIKLIGFLYLALLFSQSLKLQEYVRTKLQKD